MPVLQGYTRLMAVSWGHSGGAHLRVGAGAAQPLDGGVASLAGGGARMVVVMGHLVHVAQRNLACTGSSGTV